MELREIVSRNPEVVSGDLVFTGTRVPVKNLIDYLAAGDTLEEFLDDFPGVRRAQAGAYLRITMRFADERLAEGRLAEEQLAVDEADAADDPILDLGQRPVRSGVSDGSENHDLYIYGG